MSEPKDPEAPATRSDPAPDVVSSPAEAEAAAPKPPDLVKAPPVEAEAAVEAPAEAPEEADALPEGTPRIHALEPARGPLGGVAEVVVRGEAFEEGCKVLVDGAEVPAAREDAATLRVAIPGRASSGYVDVRVVNPDGKNEVRVRGFCYDAPPHVARIEPPCVPVDMGGSITIHGADFAEGCSVSLGDALLLSTRMDASRIESVAPPREAGELEIAVQNPDGQRGAHVMRFEETPAVTGVSPAGGLTTGGDAIVVVGRGFVAGCAVRVGGAAATEVAFEDAGRLRATAPPGAFGPADVAVVNPSGLAHTLRGAFSYKRPPPRIASVSPDVGPSAGGTRLAVRGRDFEQGCAVLVCGIPAAVSFQGSDALEVITPPVARDGAADVRVINPDDQGHTAERAFRYQAALPPPVLATVSPTQGPQTGGTKVALLGEDFAEGVRVRFGGVQAEVRFLTRKELEAVAPAYARAGEVPVDVVNPDGQTASLEPGFTYEAIPGPVIESVRPANGPTTGGTRVVIEGEHFRRDAWVTFGRERPKEVVVKSATEIHVVTAPRKTAGVVDVEVGVGELPRALMKNGFRYDAVPAPTISSVSPNRGGTSGGTELTISGKNFTKETAVLLDGKPAKSVKLIDAATLEVKTPPGEANKMVDVAVRNPDGKEAVVKRAFVYDPRYG